MDTYSSRTGKLGDATYESRWYGNVIDYGYYPYPWMARGGSCGGATTTGTFTLTHGGGADGYYSFRIVILGK